MKSTTDTPSFLSIQDIGVTLISSTSLPYETSVASAKTCYSGKGIVYPEQVSMTQKAIDARDRIAKSTLQAGHLTTRQHAHFTFGISNISRFCLWSFLHSHPFYNSEQVSQRYVKVKPHAFVLPNIENTENREIFAATAKKQMAAYETLLTVLRPLITEEFLERFPGRKNQLEKWASTVDKRVYEVARYVVGIGQTAYLYHSISALTLMRYFKLCHLFDVPEEQRILVRKMIDAVAEKDPLFLKDISDPLPLEDTAEYNFLILQGQSLKLGNSESAKCAIQEFDRKLEGRVSKIMGATDNATEILRLSLGLVLGKSDISEQDAVSLLLDPQRNPIRSDNLNASCLDKLSHCLRHVHFSFYKKLSHCADSQDQRHRMVFSSRPFLLSHYTGKPDFVTPYAISASPLGREVYESTLSDSFSAINELLSRGVSAEKAFYLLPNAFPIRMISSGDLHAWHHKWKMRSCYNAQEEIFRATLDEIHQVSSLYPTIGQFLRAPCYLRLRSQETPYCPEGSHYCGLPVWKFELKDYQRKSL